MNAPRGPFSTEDLEDITRRLEAIKAKAVEADTDSDDFTDDDVSLTGSESSSTCSEITWKAYTTTQILSGAETVEKFLKDSRDEYWNNVAKMQERFWDVQGESRQLVAFKTSELSHLQEYRQQLFHLIQVVKRQLSRKENAAMINIQRSQNYQSRLASNAEYLPRLQDQYFSIKSFTDTKQDELQRLEEAEDVARSSHPRHLELAWIFCYTDTCSIHRLSKEHFGYWPRKRKAIYWDHEPKTDG